MENIKKIQFNIFGKTFFFDLDLLKEKVEAVGGAIENAVNEAAFARNDCRNLEIAINNADKFNVKFSPLRVPYGYAKLFEGYSPTAEELRLLIGYGLSMAHSNEIQHMSNLQFYGANFYSSSFYNSPFLNSNFKNCLFNKCTFTGVDFSNSNLTNCEFINTHYAYAPQTYYANTTFNSDIFINTVIDNTIWTGADFPANYRDVNVIFAKVQKTAQPFTFIDGLKYKWDFTQLKFVEV